MRLDKYLEETKKISSRTKAKNAIKAGLVSVNGSMVNEPDFEIKGNEKIDVLDEKLAEMPKGYFKLQNLLTETKAVYKNDIVLDLGSSAGGYLMKVAEIATRVYGIEISHEFKKDLQKVVKEHSNVRIMLGNVFKVDINEACPEKVDVILNDMTLEPLLSFTGLERFLPKLKNSGKILMTLKLQGASKDEVKELAKNVCNRNNLEIINFIDSDEKDEMFLYAQKLPSKFGWQT